MGRQSSPEGEYLIREMTKCVETFLHPVPYRLKILSRVEGGAIREVKSKGTLYPRRSGRSTELRKQF